LVFSGGGTRDAPEEGTRDIGNPLMGREGGGHRLGKAGGGGGGRGMKGRTGEHAKRKEKGSP